MAWNGAASFLEIWSDMSNPCLQGMVWQGNFGKDPSTGSIFLYERLEKGEPDIPATTHLSRHQDGADIRWDKHIFMK